MKGGSPLGNWLREFGTLVFTQTLQAFLYAVVLSFILYGMSHLSSNTSESNLSLGMMSVFALLSVFNIEKLLRQIMGIGESKASPGSAIKSVAKTAIAFQLGKRLMDNVSKVGKGAKGMVGYRKENEKIKKRYDEDVENLGLNGRSGSRTGSTSSASGGNASKNGISTAVASAGGAYDDLEPDVGSVGGAGASSKDALKLKRAYTTIQRNYDDAMKANLDKRNEAIKSIAKGLTETAGATIGAPSGLILGGADGDIDGALRGVVSGAGVGDIVGEKVIDSVSAVNSIKSTISKAAQSRGMSNKALKNYIDNQNEQIKEVLKNMDIDVGNI